MPVNGPINVVAVTNAKMVELSNVLFVNVCVAVNCTILLLLIKGTVTALPANRYPGLSLGIDVLCGKPLDLRHSAGVTLRSPMHDVLLAGWLLHFTFAVLAQCIRALCLLHIHLSLGHLTRPVLPEARHVGNSPIGCHTLFGHFGLPTLSTQFLNPAVSNLNKNRIRMRHVSFNQAHLILNYGGLCVF